MSRFRSLDLELAVSYLLNYSCWLRNLEDETRIGRAQMTVSEPLLVVSDDPPLMLGGSRTGEEQSTRIPKAHSLSNP